MNRQDDDPFVLRNDPPKCPRPENVPTRQLKLLPGLDLLPGQQDLFATDGPPAEPPAGDKRR